MSSKVDSSEGMVEQQPVPVIEPELKEQPEEIEQFKDDQRTKKATLMQDACEMFKQFGTTEEDIEMKVIQLTSYIAQVGADISRNK